MSLFVVRGDRLAARKVGGEMVILSADDSSLFVLNEIGTAIWEAADGRTSLHAIAEGVCQAYDVDRETALRDVEAFVSDLAAAGVVSTSEHAVE
ncbi:MAG TPA: PqqD family protein [Vicinamibacterales bacterium]|jgi:hypothetical protein|nr:PqqD family protein [Vicinamibacterales bacterium]